MHESWLLKGNRLKRWTWHARSRGLAVLLLRTWSRLCLGHRSGGGCRSSVSGQTSLLVSGACLLAPRAYLSIFLEGSSWVWKELAQIRKVEVGGIRTVIGVCLVLGIRAYTPPERLWLVLGKVARVKRVARHRRTRERCADFEKKKPETNHLDCSVICSRI